MWGEGVDLNSAGFPLLPYPHWSQTPTAATTLILTTYIHFHQAGKSTPRTPRPVKGVQHPPDDRPAHDADLAVVPEVQSNEEVEVEGAKEGGEKGTVSKEGTEGAAKNDEKDVVSTEIEVAKRDDEKDIVSKEDLPEAKMDDGEGVVSKEGIQAAKKNDENETDGREQAELRQMAKNKLMELQQRKQEESQRAQEEKERLNTTAKLTLMDAQKAMEEAESKAKATMDQAPGNAQAEAVVFEAVSDHESSAACMYEERFQMLTGPALPPNHHNFNTCVPHPTPILAW